MYQIPPTNIVTTTLCACTICTSNKSDRESQTRHREKVNISRWQQNRRYFPLSENNVILISM